jgi:hypothetical protein
MDEQETQAMAALDDRARRAAQELRDRVAAVHAQKPVQVTAAALSRNGDGTVADDEHADGDAEGDVARGVTHEREDVHDAGDVIDPDPDPDPVADADADADADAATDITSDAILLRPAGVRRRAWLAAAAVMVLVLGAGAFVMLRDDSSPSTVTGQPGQGYLVADWLPEGLELQRAAMVSGDDPEMSSSERGDLAVYGDGSLDDPWDGPILVAETLEEPNPEIVEFLTEDAGYPDFEEVTVGDAAGVIETGYQGTLTVHIPAGDGTSTVTGYGFDRDELLAAAEHLTNSPAVGDEGLPDGYEEIARGPRGAAFSPAGMSWDGLRLTYEVARDGIDPDDPDFDVLPGIGISQQSGGPQAAALIRLMVISEGLEAEVEQIEVRGQEAYVLHESTAPSTGSDGCEPQPSTDAEVSACSIEGASSGHEHMTVQWYEPSVGKVVTVSATDQDEADVLQFVEELRVADEGELQGMIDEHGGPPDGEDVISEDTATEVVPADAEDAAADEDVRSEPGDVVAGGYGLEPVNVEVITEGEHEGEPWKLSYIEFDDGSAILEWHSESQGWGNTQGGQSDDWLANGGLVQASVCGRGVCGGLRLGPR